MHVAVISNLALGDLIADYESHSRTVVSLIMHGWSIERPSLWYSVHNLGKVFHLCYIRTFFESYLLCPVEQQSGTFALRKRFNTDPSARLVPVFAKIIRFTFDCDI